MKPNERAYNFLAITRSKAKMYEYNVPEEYHIDPKVLLTDLLDLTIAIIGNITTEYETTQEASQTDNEKLLEFSAKYMDALINSKTASDLTNYLQLICGAAYYLAGYPGSAMVLIKKINNLDLNASGLDKIIYNLLSKQKINVDFVDKDNQYGEIIQNLSLSINSFYETGNYYNEVKHYAKQLKNEVYLNGSDRELLFGDIIYAICLRTLRMSSWLALPRYSGVDINLWMRYLESETALKELWPAQMLLGEHGIYRGKSAVIQMPTSAGKTRASEIIIRSAFINSRANLVVIVAPFRALCHEIYNDMLVRFDDEEDVNVSLVSDVFLMDMELEEGTELKNILILTPEKLEYILRHSPEMASIIGLIIYDEGHLFDDGERGTKYELLLASLKRLLPNTAQIVLISAVIPNAEEIGKWLIGSSFSPIKATHLTPTQKNIAFISWNDRRGQLKFVDAIDINKDEFFVPRVIESQELSLRKRERKKRIFPDRHEPSHVAIAIGCRLVINGSVAIFTGRKDSATLIAKQLIDAFERDCNLPKPVEYCDSKEMERLIKYLERTLGVGSTVLKAACYGVLLHHGSIPNTIRLAAEYALQKEHARFVICTSTLSQGVNLPIRYLIVTNDRQGKEKIKVRDFHNLMGRAGRAGKYTEGTVIFSDRRIFDLKDDYMEGWRWRSIRELLDPSNSETCKSHILTLYDLEPLFIDEKEEWADNINRIISDINTYLLNFLGDATSLEEAEAYTISLLENTLAYFQANEDQRSRLKKTFTSIAKEIFEREPSPERRKVFAKAVVDLNKSQEILKYLEDNIKFLETPQNPISILDYLWDIIFAYGKFPKTIDKDKQLSTIKMWINGDGYPLIYDYLSAEKFGNRNATIEHITYLCEGLFGFNASLIVGTCVELLELVQSWNRDNETQIRQLQKMLKYGLPTPMSINLYELGLVDRNLALEVAKIIGTGVRKPNKRVLINLLKRNRLAIKSLIENNYPAFFDYQLIKVLSYNV